ncbi:GLUG motif-containing protein [Marinoscillum furvescens]|uniref:GLUG motif-containing protein n=1 Tax=Marinoscillum furvescens DSM 4134 TaxID=1122208 RepID=A0A3D9KWF2_MARFU|nr:GLUG motif-containing protein [Marinoscillum furvescens]RED92466.1 GLUG motif-containing protein [Marinoscillum furvescens DSM 4134]
MNRFYYYIVCLLLWGLWGCGELGLDLSEEGEEGTVEVSISGLVIEALEIPVGVPHAEVVVDGYHTTADEEGFYSFTIPVLAAELGSYDFEVSARDFQTNAFRHDVTDKQISVDVALERLRTIAISTSSIDMGFFESEVAVRLENNTSFDAEFNLSTDDPNLTISPQTGVISASHATHDFVDVIVSVDRTVFTSGVKRSLIHASIGNRKHEITLKYNTQNPDDLNWVDEDHDRLIDIRTIDDLYRMSIEHHRDTFDAFVGFELVTNLDFEADTSYRNLALKEQLSAVGGWIPIGAHQKKDFPKKFVGNGHYIRHLSIESQADYVGLFAYTAESASIEDVALLDVSISGDSYVGGLVGASKGRIYGCSVSGTVSGSSSVGVLLGWQINGTVEQSFSEGLSKASGNQVGGLIGLLGYRSSDRPYVLNSFSTATVRGVSDVGGLIGARYSGYPRVLSCYATGRVIANGQSVGGLIGAFSGELSNCYATGAVESNSYYVGGLIGDNSGTVVSSYAIGTVSGASKTGGLLGRNSGSVTGTNYWDVTSSGMDSSYGGVGYPTQTLKGVTSDVSIYLTWDETSWDFGDANVYPALKNMPVGLDVQWDRMMNNN